MIEFRIPASANECWSQRAADGLVGQTLDMTVDGLPRSTATITAARLDGCDLIVEAV